MMLTMNETEVSIQVDGHDGADIWVGRHYFMNDSVDRMFSFINVHAHEVFQDITNEIVWKSRRSSDNGLDIFTHDIFSQSGDEDGSKLTTFVEAFNSNGIVVDDKLTFSVADDTADYRLIYPIEPVSFTIGELKTLRKILIERDSSSAIAKELVGSPANVLEVERRRIVIKEMECEFKKLDSIRSGLLANVVTKNKVASLSEKADKCEKQMKYLKQQLHGSGFGYDAMYVRDLLAEIYN